MPENKINITYKTNKDLLYSTGNDTQYFAKTYKEKESEKVYTHTHTHMCNWIAALYT